MTTTFILIPPQTKHEISATEFVNAVYNEPIKETDWFYCRAGKHIENRELFPNVEFDNDKYYIVLTETKCLQKNGCLLQLMLQGNNQYRPTLIFLKCILPGFLLSATFTDEWIFIDTHIEKRIQIEQKSQVGI